MNKIEYLLSELEKKLEEAVEFHKDKVNDAERWVIDPLRKKIAFFDWLLSEDDNEEFHCEYHATKVEPTVWGDGDTSFNVKIQVEGKSDFRDDDPGFERCDIATVLIFKYPEREVS